MKEYLDNIEDTEYFADNRYWISKHTVGDQR